MANLDEFRTQVSSWLQDNCPLSMRTPTPEGETIWGGRHEQFVNPDSRLRRRALRRGWPVMDLAW